MHADKKVLERNCGKMNTSLKTVTREPSEFDIFHTLVVFRLHDMYKPVSKTSFIDETLFAKTEGTAEYKN